MAHFKLPNVSTRYGAPMGRRNFSDGSPADLPRKFWLRRVRLDSGGYDNGGAYWGHGAPLYYAETESVDGEVVRYFRASDREAAKAAIRAEFPNATFFR